MKLNVEFKDKMVITVHHHSKFFCSEISAIYCMMIDILNNNLTSKELLNLSIKKDIKILTLDIKNMIYEEFIICSSAILSFIRLVNTFKTQYKKKFDIKITFLITNDWSVENKFLDHGQILQIISILKYLNEK